MGSLPWSFHLALISVQGRLAAQFIDIPDWGDTRSLTNALEGCVDAVLSRAHEASVPRAASVSSALSKEGKALSEEIAAIEAQLSRYQHHVVRLRAELAAAPPPCDDSGTATLRSQWSIFLLTYCIRW